VGKFGDKFRKEREKKNISLDDVSNVTKISSRMLQAIEQERFDQLPGGVFNKGFIRAYAKHLGLNDEDAVNDYLACLRQAQIDAHEVWEPERTAHSRPAPEKRPLAPYAKPSLKSEPAAEVEELPELQLPRAEHVRPPRNKYLNERDRGIPWGLIAVAGLVVVLAIILWTRHARAPRPASTATSVPAPTTLPAPITQPTAVAAPPTANTKPAASGHTAVNATTPRPATQQPAVHAPTIASSTPAAASNTTAPPSSGEPPQPAPQSTPLTLVIRASETSWISVTADGREVSQETLIAPAHASFRANREIIAKVGNAAGVSFLWNGKEVPTQGAEGEPRTFVFDSSGLRAAPPVEPAH